MKNKQDENKDNSKPARRKHCNYTVKHKGGNNVHKKEFFSDSSRCKVGVHNCQLLSNQITSLNLCLGLKPCL